MFAGATRSVWPATLLAAFVTSTLMSIPAAAQIETVVVTAEKKAEDIQAVPIAVTAFTGQDLKLRQVLQFKDLQFHLPNVTYTNTNFGGANFQIRGIGIAAVGYDAETGTAIHIDDVFLANPPITEATFYDIDRIEVLRGPQSTLYGRGATGGTVNIITAKPVLDTTAATIEAAYGNYNESEIKAMLNVPLVDNQLGVRLAGDWLRHDGFVTNIFNGHKVDSNDTYSFRGSVRWQPTDDTSIDVVGSYSHEGDSHMRSVKQLCTRDPTAILGCLPDSLGTDAINVNAQFTNTISSVQGFTGALGGLSTDAGNLGLFDLTLPAHTGVGNVNPSSYRKINSDFDPKYKTSETFFEVTAKQKLSDWLDATFVGGYEDDSYFSQESYNNIGGVPLDQSRLGLYCLSGTLGCPLANSSTALGTLYSILSGNDPNAGLLYFLTGLGGFTYTPAYANLYNPFFAAVPGQLPISSLKGLGTTGFNIAYFSPNQTVYDQSDGYSKQYSAELRFATHFDGPFNFLLAGYYLRTTGHGDYYVPGNVIDYPTILLGGFLGPLIGPAACQTVGCTFGPDYYHNFGRKLELESKAVFGEAYYDAIPDYLKFTLGLRFTDDHKSDLNRIAFVSGMIPLGSMNEDAADATLVAQHQTDFDATNGTPPFDVFQHSQKSFDKFTGRAVVDWFPDTGFTDKTHVYASYSRGYKSGGFNPGAQAGLNFGVNPSFTPEGLDAFEIGAKNTLLDNTLQANLTAWYYNYEGFQVSAIIQNTSVNSNVDAVMWGEEGEFIWQPTEAWAFDLNVGFEHSGVGNTSLVDPRNPSAGRADAVLIKDATATGGAGQNCVVYRLPANVANNTPADAGVTGYFAPPGGETALAAHGVPFANFGLCAPAVRPSEATMEAAGFSYEDPTAGPVSPAVLAARDASGGVPVHLKGNKMPYSPSATVSIGGQYTMQVGGGFTLVPRLDFYWQDNSWIRVFEDKADAVKNYTQLNGLITLSAPDSKWYVQVYAKNIENNRAQTGGYLTSSTSALYTNAFLVDPRTVGFRVGANF
jgi:outer membrane receptor protein involved in Fe transport